MKKFLVITLLFFFNCKIIFAATITEELTQLNNLFKEGAITKEEFSKAKSLLLKTGTTTKKNITEKVENKKESEKKRLSKKNQKIEKKKKKLPKVIKEEKSKEFNFVSANRSEIEIKNGIFLEDVEEFGTFNNINTAPLGMFEAKQNQFVKMSKYSQSKVGLFFVSQKAILDKFPENLMLGMGYFEFFYMQQLKDNKKDIIAFKNKYPNIGWTKANVKKTYSLNKARKAMRNALGFTLEDDVQEVLNTYYTLSKLFSIGEKQSIELSNEDKKLFNIHLKIAKNLSIVKNLVNDKNEQRISDKKFKKEYLKLYKKVDREVKRLKKYDNYSQLNKFLDMIQEIEISDISTLLSAYNVANFLLAEIKNKDVKKRFKIDLTNADFSKFNENELKLLGEISNKTKLIKAQKSNKIQLDILNLVNNNISINKVLDNFRANSLELESIYFQMESEDNMKRWVRKDWANAWRTPIPEKIDDTSRGIMIDLSEEDVESIKAQLSIDHYKDLINLDITKELNDNVNDIQNSIDTSTYSFSYGLDDYAQFLGDYMNLDIKNYADLTALANATYNANWSVEEYASAYQYNVDAINALASGASSFDVASMGESIGASLQDAADTIAAASAAGISVDLEAAAAGAGFGSFADAVKAYNAEHGTSYTTESAREALGQ